MSSSRKPTALIADDEPLLAEGLRSDLAAVWPELQVVATVHDGASALEQALAQRPQVCFLDIRMPGLDGLEAARALVEDWPQDGPAFPLLVFVTAYDQHALAAFEAQAVDYLVKPVDRERLGRCVARLQGLLSRTREAGDGPDPHATARLLADTLEQLRGLAAGSPALAPAAPAAARAPGGSGGPAGAGSPDRLTVVQAQVGSTVHMVPLEEVLYFEAADKYVRVVTAEREHLIRTSLRELLPRLDPAVFWQVHRSTVVQARCIASALREESGIVRLRLRGHKDVLTASRLYAHLFRGM